MKKLSRREFLQGTAASALTLAMAGMFGGTGAYAEESGDGTTVLKLSVTSSISTFNWKNKSNPGGFKSHANFIEPLVLVDAINQSVPGIAESWEYNDDATVWTFHLREGASWVDYQGNYMAEVVADDFLWGLEWVLNYQKNSGTNSSTPINQLVGAGDYYEYTKTLSEEEGMALGLDTFKEMVTGAEAVDDYTLVFTLNQSCVYFDNIVTMSAFWPIAGGQLEQYGVDGFETATYDTIWYCGPYTMTKFVEANSEVFTKNPLYWNIDETFLYDEVRRTVVESTDVSYEMYWAGEVDRVELSASYISMLLAEGKEDYIVMDAPNSVTWYIIFNYNKKNTDGTVDENWNTAVANEAFRKCFYYGLDLTNWLALTYSIDPSTQFNSTLCPYDLCKFSDGRDYTDRVLELLGLERETETFPHQDAELFASYKAQAMEELTAQGVTFPVTIEHWASSSQGDQDAAIVLKNAMENCLGTDMVTVNINTYVQSASQEYIYPGYYSVAFDGSSAAYNDPLGLLDFLSLDNEEGDFTNVYGDVPNCSSEEVIALWQELTDMIHAADAILDLDDRYEAFAQAEVFAIDHALLLPSRVYRVSFISRYISYGAPSKLSEYLNARYTNMGYISGDGCTQEDYEAARAALYGEA